MIDINEVIKKFVRKNYIFLISISVLFLSLLFMPKMIVFIEVFPGLSIRSLIFLMIIGLIVFFILYKSRNIMLYKFIYFIYSYFTVKIFFNKIRKNFSLNKYNPFNYIVFKELLFNKNIILTKNDINNMVKNNKIVKGRSVYYLKLIIFSKLLNHDYDLDKYIWKNISVEYPVLKELKEALKKENSYDIEYIFQNDFLENKKLLSDDELLYKVIKWLLVFECLRKNKIYNNFLKLNYERLAGLLYNLKHLAPQFINYINKRYFSL